MSVRELIEWFSGGPNGYMSLVDCMNHDWLWIWTTVILNLAVASGYVIIALHWRRNERHLAESPAKSALSRMKTIFILCGLCGYLFIPIKTFWPAWRLYDGFLLILVFMTWRYALGTRQLAVVYNEIGRTKQLSSELEEARQEGRRKSHFLIAISHDLRTPLNGLMLQTELAQMSLASQDTESVRDSLKRINVCARTTSDLLNSFLELGRLDWSDELMQTDVFPIKEMMNNLAAEFRTRAEQKGLKLDLPVGSDLILSTDRVMLERMLRNLLDNAIKYTSQGEVRVAVEMTSAGLAIHVIDSGEGIALDQQTLIFDDFTQVNNRERDSRKGFGLGLGLARRLARHLGGHITLESDPGRGSRFTLRLPSTSVSGHSAPNRLSRAGAPVADSPAAKASSG